MRWVGGWVHNFPVSFLQDVVYRKSLKPADFSWGYSKNKGESKEWRFLKHTVYI